MARSYLNEIRVTRNSQGRHRSLAGGLVVGDYIDQSNGERVLTIKMVAGSKAAKKAKAQPKGREVAAGLTGEPYGT